MSESIRGDRPGRVALSADAVAAMTSLRNVLDELADQVDDRPLVGLVREARRNADVLIDEIQGMAADSVAAG